MYDFLFLSTLLIVAQNVAQLGVTLLFFMKYYYSLLILGGKCKKTLLLMITVISNVKNPCPSLKKFI